MTNQPLSEKRLIICKICSEEVNKGNLTYGLEQFLFWDNEEEAKEHFKRKHPKIAKECGLFDNIKDATHKNCEQGDKNGNTK